MGSRLAVAIVPPLCTALAAPAEAHHEAIFGPQSALVLSSSRYFTAQVFTRQTGPKDERVQETTTVLSGGLTPTRFPVSLSFVVPFSVIAAGSHGGTRPCRHRRDGVDGTVNFPASGQSPTTRIQIRLTIARTLKDICWHDTCSWMRRRL